MRILFANRSLERLCSEESRMKRKLGPSGARKLKARLADLRAAARVRDLVAGHPHPLTGDREGQFAVDLDGGRRLVFAPADEPLPRNEDGSIAWPEVTAACIVFVGDYHD